MTVNRRAGAPSRTPRRSGAAPGRVEPPGAAAQGRLRAVIEGVRPEIDAGRFPIKRTLLEPVVVEADVFADGHDEVAAGLLFRGPKERSWRRVPMEALGNDRWRGAFVVEELGRHRYTLEAWVDEVATWQRDLRKRLDAGQDPEVELLVGAELLRSAAERLRKGARRLREAAERLAAAGDSLDRVRVALDPELAALARAAPPPWRVCRYSRELEVVVDRVRARFGAWYEMFPRSAAAEPGTHGTFDDVIRRLPYVAGMGFDVLYLPPVHPIGRAHRKGKNNAPAADPGDIGSPWAIGAAEGGHDAFHPELGDEDDFRRLVRAAAEHGLEIALDFALQCSPDHPWVREHPQWFRHLPDGSIRYAENPPKKYQDIYPLDFETEDWRALWQACNEVLRVWIERGVRIFRVDNPHTKPFAFWEWLIADIERDHPDVIFLSEAFTRPRRLERLAKLGFHQSYNYFPWRNDRAELEQYLSELTSPPIVDYLRANLWTNTPDILTTKLQHAARPAFAQRLVLAATLGASYGIYGPPFELLENTPRGDGSEEYLHSEKYELRHWPIERTDGLRDLVTKLNQIRRDEAALQSDRRLRFHRTDNDRVICYSKTTPELDSRVLVLVNLDPQWTQSGFTDLDLGALGLEGDEAFEAHDLLVDERYPWRGRRNYFELDPWRMPAHVLRLRARPPVPQAAAPQETRATRVEPRLVREDTRTTRVEPRLAREETRATRVEPRVDPRGGGSVE